MDAAKRLADKHNLQDLVPLNALSDSRFAEIAQKIVIEEIKKGKYLFRKGDRDNQSVFLLDGKIILIDAHRKVIGEVEAGTDISRYPIASQQPRTLSVRAVTKVVIARIDSGLLDVFLTWDQTSGTEATEIKAEDNEDWMTRMLQSDAFIKLPPEMIQRLLIRMESCRVQKGEVIIRQGDEGDFFYTIHKGTCVVTRIPEDGEEMTLAELSDGDCFGEESLVSDTRRNASVTMTSDGLLMRLAKKDFIELLQKPLVRHVGYKEADKMVEEGAVWVDVRSPGEYENTAFEDSVNIPLAELRGEMPELVYNAKYVICCDTGRRSASAAFILSHKGFEVYVLESGINGLPRETQDEEVSPAQDNAVAGGEPVADAEVIDLKATQDAATDAQAEAMEPVSTGEDGPEPGQGAELEALRSEVAGLRRQLDDHTGIEQQLAGSEELASGLQQHVSQLEEQLAGLTHKYEAVLAERNSDRERLALLQAATETSTQEQQEVQAARSSELESLQAEIASLQAEKQAAGEEAGSHIARHEAAISELQAELESLGKRSDGLDKELDAERQRAADLQEQLEARVAGQESEAAVLQEQNGQLQQSQDALQAEIDALRSEKQAAEDQAGNRMAEQQAHSQQLQAALDAAQSEKHDILAQLEALRESQAENCEQLDQRSEQAELARSEAAGLQQELERLQSEKRELEESQSARQVAEEALQDQRQEWDGERAALQEEFGQERKQLQDELQQALAGGDEIRQKLENEIQQGSALQQEVENLNDRLSALTAEKAAEIDSLNRQLQAGQQRVAEAGQQLEATAASDEALRARLVQQEETSGQLRQEVESQAQQLEAVRLELQQTVEQARSSELESEETLSKAWADLNRKNDTEKDLQGQITRLRKKLEQSTTDLQQVREEAREAASQARDVLHAERKERADERAQMAARQKELKEQLVAVAGQHEALQSSQKGVLAEAESAARDDERARLQEVLDNHAQTEGQLAAMRQELAQAREETERAVSEERQRHTADLDLVRVQKSELDAVVAEQEARLQELTGERDAAVSERQSIREQFNSLRAEVEVARGLINASDGGEVENPVKLRAELEEMKRNLDIAIRVRSEAESARDSALAEREAMQRQLEDAVTDGLPLTIPSLDEQGGTDPGEESSPATVDTFLPNGPAVSSAKTGDAAATAPGRSRIRSWLGMTVGLGVVALALAAFWFLLENRDGLFPAIDPGTLTFGDAESLSGGMDHEVPGPVQPVATPAATTGTPDSVKPVQPAATPAVDTHTPEAEKPAVTADARPEPEPGKVPATVPEITPLAAGRSFSDVLRGGGRGPTVVELPAADYMMGSGGASPNFAERPRHTVTLPAFAIGKHEVSFAEYDRFARATGRRLPYDEGWGRGKRPVINVSWKDATAYAAWLSKQTGHTYRLPTEAQWEFAARAGTGTPYWWPKSSKEVPANCFDCGSQWDGKKSAAVGSFSPNGFGLHDTAGNVQEWTQDCYHKNYKGAPSDGSAWQSAGCSQRVIRGGAYSSPLGSLRSARRAQFDQESRMDNIGFRVVRIK